MRIEIKSGEQQKQMELIKKVGNLLTVRLNEKQYELDIIKVQDGIYSVIYNNVSFDFEITQNAHSKSFNVKHRCLDYNIEILDAQSRYKQSRNAGNSANDDKIIHTPMPGKVIKIDVKEGQEVKKGDNLLTLSAMKMENEYTSPVDGTIKHIFIKQDQRVETNQKLIEIE